MTDVFSVSSLEEYIKIVERFSPNFSLSRGQGSDLPLFPSALRRDQDGMRLYSKTTIQSFLEDFKFNSQMYIEGASTYHENDWLIHAQHFGVPTCLLDFTYSHLVSLMFALEKAFDYDQDDEDTFYEEEWNRIVIAQEALTLEKYVKATRNGRGTRLDRKKRMQVWKVFENYQNLMKENQIRDINTAMYESTKLLQSAGRKPRYASIIIDEGQDFSDNAYRLIRALAGEEHPNDIFIVGDSHQRIYRNYPTLSKCGINVRGRSSILKINYRTTEEIRKHAFALLNGISFDDLDEDLDLGDKCQSLTHGEKPIVENFENANDEFDFLLREVKKLKENGVSLTDICVVARTKKLVDDYIALFTRAGIRSYAIKRNKVDDRSFDGLRVATMHRVKGLEFKYVFIAAVNNRIIPLPFAINKTDAVSEVESITSEKCLLYVAMTRAQKGVYITSYGRPSEFLV
ncbi:3'-5' exonuclease [Blautia sp.]|uniref:3'-5' exonuclease n=1 Tax=Blautia sp. TaxID=1955243 RepID=UPI003AB38DCF